MLIGLDFDNTLAGYDGVFASAARVRGLVPVHFSGGKAEVRASLRALPDGETEWMRLQGRVYGFHMPEAELIQGAATFMLRARAAGHRLAVVSHKTRFGHFDPDRIDLRQAARIWMRAQGFFDRFGLDEADVHFAETRAEKVERIAALGCDHFVDDLEEVFREPGFPAATTAWLFTNGRGAEAGPWRALPHWSDLADAILGSA